MLCKHLPLNPVPNNCCSPSNSKCDVLFNWVQCTFLNSQMWIYLFHWYLFVCVCFERVSPTMTGLRDRPLPHLTWDHKCQDYESIFLCLACVYNLAACRESLQLTQDYNNSPQSLRHQPEKGFTNVSNNMLLLYFFLKWYQGWEWSSLVECSWSWIWSLDRAKKKGKKAQWSKIDIYIDI